MDVPDRGRPETTMIGLFNSFVTLEETAQKFSHKVTLPYLRCFLKHSQH